MSARPRTGSTWKMAANRRTEAPYIAGKCVLHGAALLYPLKYLRVFVS
jgi:hypothetical protein